MAIAFFTNRYKITHFRKTISPKMNIKHAILIGALCAAAPLAIAGPESGPVGITSLRPYMSEPANGEARIYISLDSDVFCGTNVFSIDNTRPGSKQAYAAALSALVAGKKNQLEVDACAGWGTTLRSLYIIQ
ncbi:hypothetical protein [Janthinobacterium sp. AD80]|uniref:hypothetical protein n=1 Tax=Janthinobacterium sp. AD80 TaxID=1528773 RepID=UPI001CA51419|nr:hypothetical protein [Janthinobacterium sp. AD80]